MGFIWIDPKVLESGGISFMKVIEASAFNPLNEKEEFTSLHFA